MRRLVLTVLLWVTTAQATAYNVKVDCGATGDGVADDTAEINTCIAGMIDGDTLFFPSGTYLISSALSAILDNSVTLFGELSGSTKLSTIQATGTGYTMLTVGSTSLSAYTLLVASSSEGDTTLEFDDEAISLSAGDYFWCKEGDETYGGTNFDGDGMICSVSGCRGEVFKAASISLDVTTVENALTGIQNGAHYFYDLGLGASNDPRCAKLQSPTTGVIVKDLIIDGGGNGVDSFGTTTTLRVQETADFTGQNLELRDVSGVGLSMQYNYNTVLTDIVLRHCAGVQSACFENRRWGHFTINDLNIAEVNNQNSTFGFSPYEGADGVWTDVYVDKDDIPGGTWRTGRGAKYNATSYVISNNFTVTKVPVTQGTPAEGGTAGNGDNGISIEYYSSNNTFNNCTILDNGGNGVAGWGESDLNNRFNNCSFSGGGIYQVAIHGNDHNWKFVDGSCQVRGGQNCISVWSTAETINGLHVESIVFTESPAGSSVGVQQRGSDGCIRDNTFTSVETAIDVDDGTNIGLNNTLGGGSDDSAAGSCSSLITSGKPNTGKGRGVPK